MTHQWEDQSIILFRSLINDTVDPYTYDDCRVKNILLTAAYLNIQDVDFDSDYTIDLLLAEITPDPPESAFISLMVLRGVSLLANSEWKTESRQGIVVRDGPTSIDMTGRLDTLKDYAAASKAAYDKAVISYKTGNRNIGIAIVGPSRFDLQPLTNNRFY